MRFLVYSPQLLESCPNLERAYISGSDGRIFPTRIEISDRLITCRRAGCESGRFQLAWPVPGFGVPVVTTASLPEREEPYLLALELARGKIAQVRDQVSLWEVSGMSLPDSCTRPLSEAHRAFRDATGNQDQPAVAEESALRSLRLAFESAEAATASYAAQRLAARRKRTPELPVALGCGLGLLPTAAAASAGFLEVFDAAAVPISWNLIEAVKDDYRWDLCDAQVEWCVANRLLIRGGPLLDFSPQGLPPWLSSCERSLPNLQCFLCDFIETAVGRYAGHIRNWEVCVGGSTGGALALSEEGRLTLVARALEAVRHVNDDMQLMIRVDQPWGEYQSRGQHRLSPLQFVDALLRAGIGLSAVNLEIAHGFDVGGSAPRDLLDLSRFFDAWSALGVPLHVTLALPSEIAEPDSSATGALAPHSGGRGRERSEAAQAQWIDSLLPLLTAKQAISAIFWTHFSDQVPHDFPQAGLLRADGTPKPAFAALRAQRTAGWISDGDPATSPSSF